MNKLIVAVGLSLLFYSSFGQYSSIISANATGREVALDFICHTNSDYYLTGIQDPGPLGSRDIIVIKIDTNNNVIWSKAYGDTNYNSTVEIRELNDSNLLLIGFNINTPANYFSSIIIKMDQNGDTLWTKIIYDSIQHVFLKYLSESGDTIKLFGEFGGGDSLYKGIIVEINAITGELIWSKSYSTLNNLETHFYKCERHKGGNQILILSKTVTDSITLSEKEFLNIFDYSGNPVKSIEIADSATSTYSLIAVSEQSGDILIGMNNHRNTFPGGNNFLLCLLDSALNLKYAKEFGSGFGITAFQDAIFTDSASMISLMGGQASVYLLDSTGNIFSINKVYFDPLYPGAVIGLYKIIAQSDKLIGAGNISLTGGSHDNVLFAKSKLNGTGCQNSLFSGSNTNATVSMLPGIMHVDIINSLHSLSSMNYMSVNINFNIACQTIGLYENENAIDLKIFPNPVDQIFTITGLPVNKKYKIHLFDCLGISAYYQSSVINETTANINLGELLPGLYIISISDELGNKITKRIVKI